MTKLKLLAFAGTATISLLPLKSSLSSFGDKSIPELLSDKEKEVNSLDPLGSIKISSGQFRQELDLREEPFKSINYPSVLNSDNHQSVENTHFQADKEFKGTQVRLSQDKQETDSQAIKKEANLKEWLDIINPLIKKEQKLTIITRWENWYFRLIQWNQDCQCFVFSDSEDGIWTNSSGLLTIGKKWENPHNNVVHSTTNPQCINFNGFWYQDWHTWSRFNSWLKTSKNDPSAHKAIASCYRYPVTFLETNKYFPVFVKSRTGNITTDGPMNYYYNHREGKFVRWEHGAKIPKNFSKVSSYGDWKRLWKI